MFITLVLFKNILVLGRGTGSDLPVEPQPQNQSYIFEWTIYANLILFVKHTVNTASELNWMHGIPFNKNSNYFQNHIPT